MAYKREARASQQTRCASWTGSLHKIKKGHWTDRSIQIWISSSVSMQTRSYSLVSGKQAKLRSRNDQRQFWEEVLKLCHWRWNRLAPCLQQLVVQSSTFLQQLYLRKRYSFFSGLLKDPETPVVTGCICKQKQAIYLLLVIWIIRPWGCAPRKGMVFKTRWDL